jgi:hypothetical protein
LPGIEGNPRKPGETIQPTLSPDTRPQPDLFHSRLENMLNRRHPLFRLADKIDWGFFEKEFGRL